MIKARLGRKRGEIVGVLGILSGRVLINGNVGNV